MSKIESVSILSKNKGLPEYADEYNMKLSVSGNVFAGFTGTTIPVAGVGMSISKEKFSANAGTYLGSQYNPKESLFSFSTLGTDYVYSGQDNSKIKLSLGTWLGYTSVGSSKSGFLGVIPTRLTGELPKGLKLTVSPIFERFYTNDGEDKNRLTVNTMLTGSINENLSWYVCHWLFDAIHSPGKQSNQEIDVGLVYTF